MPLPGDALGRIDGLAKPRHDVDSGNLGVRLLGLRHLAVLAVDVIDPGHGRRDHPSSPRLRRRRGRTSEQLCATGTAKRCRPREPWLEVGVPGPQGPRGSLSAIWVRRERGPAWWPLSSIVPAEGETTGSAWRGWTGSKASRRDPAGGRIGPEGPGAPSRIPHLAVACLQDPQTWGTLDRCSAPPRNLLAAPPPTTSHVAR